MKKLGIAVVLGILVLLIGCKTVPATDTTGSLTSGSQTTDPNLGPPDAAALSSLDEAKTRAENSRKQAIYLEGPAYFSQDWDAAESQYQSAAEQAEKSTLGDIKTAAGQYQSAASAYDDISRRAIPLYAQARENEIRAARSEALAAGIDEISPDRLAAADDTVQLAYDLYQGEEYYSAAETAFTSIDMYKSLKSGAEAYKAREEISNYNLAGYDAANFALAEAAGFQAVEDYDTGNIEKAHNEIDEALLRYNLALNTGWEKFSGERGKAANTERQAALDLKANVAVRNEFNAALAVYNQGESAFKAKRFRDASNFYNQSESMFSLTTKTAAEKRLLAEDAIKSAEEKMAESDVTAQNVEKILGGAQ